MSIKYNFTIPHEQLRNPKILSSLSALSEYQNNINETIYVSRIAQDLVDMMLEDLSPFEIEQLHRIAMDRNLNKAEETVPVNETIEPENVRSVFPDLSKVIFDKMSEGVWSEEVIEPQPKTLSGGDMAKFLFGAVIKSFTPENCQSFAKTLKDAEIGLQTFYDDLTSVEIVSS